MRSIIYSIIILTGLCMAASAPQAATLYLWTDDHGRMHITDEKPSEGATLRDTIEYEPVPAMPTREQPPASQKTVTDARCRNVLEARRALRKNNLVAAAVHNRAEESRNKVRDLRTRIGFDDDRRDDFKDDLKRLEEDARRAEMFSQQAELDVQMAELQVKIAETEAAKQCADNGIF